MDMIKSFLMNTLRGSYYILVIYAILFMSISLFDVVAIWLGTEATAIMFLVTSFIMLSYLAGRFMKDIEASDGQ